MRHVSKAGLSLISHHLAGGHNSVPVNHYHNETHVIPDPEEFRMGDRKQRNASFLFMGSEVEIRPLAEVDNMLFTIQGNTQCNCRVYSFLLL